MTSHKETDGYAVKPLKENPNFDYATLSSPVAEFLRAQAHRIRRQAAISIIHIGKDLIAAKHYLSHGRFLNWIEAEVGIPARTAQAYMHVAEWASHQRATVALLPPSILYFLSASSIPEGYLDEVLRRFESGERIALAAIREELKSLRKGSRNRSSRVQRDTPLDDMTSPITVEIDVQVILRHAVGILARGLSTDDFSRVREILTSNTVLEDREFGTKIARAFSSSTTNGSHVHNVLSVPAQSLAGA